MLIALHFTRLKEGLAPIGLMASLTLINISGADNLDEKKVLQCHLESSESNF